MVVSLVSINTEFVARLRHLPRMPFLIPIPHPISTTSMKTPQNTPNIVIRLRNFCWVTVYITSCHKSLSNNFIFISPIILRISHSVRLPYSGQSIHKFHRHSPFCRYITSYQSGYEKHTIGYYDHRETDGRVAEYVIIRSQYGSRSEEHTSELQSPDHL